MPSSPDSLAGPGPAQPPRDLERHGTAPERRRVPTAARSPQLAVVRAAWRAARDAHDPGDPGLARALGAYARDGRARGAPVAALLRGLDALVRPAEGGDERLDFAGARQRAGSLLIRSYYCDD